MPLFTNENLITDGVDTLAISAGGAALVDGSAVTQPISAVSLPLPTGAATEATLATRASEATLATRASEATLALVLTTSAFQARINTLGQKTMANSTPVVIASDQSAIPVTQGGTALATTTSVSVSTTVATLSASNAAKQRVVVFNEAGILFVKLGTGATSASYGYRLTANSALEIEGYTGIVTGIKSAGTTNALVTEVGI
jgi:hypothetical protein